MKIQSAFLILAGLVCLSCSNGHLAGGNGSETTNGMTGVAQAVNGSPASGALTTAIRIDDWYPGIVSGALPCDTVRTDSLGRFSFSNIPVGSYRVVISDAGYAAMFDMQINLSDSIYSAGTVGLGATSRLSGQVPNSDASVKLRLAGTTFETTPDAAGNYSFDGVPQGNVNIVAVNGAVALPIASVAVGSNATTNAGTDSIPQGFLLDDFDDGDAKSLWNDVNSSSIWYAYNDADRGGASELLPLGIRDYFTKGITDSGAWKGKSAHAEFCLAGPLANPSGAIACNLERDDKHMLDMTNLSSITFMVRGKGTIRFSVITQKVLDYPVDRQTGHLGYTFSAPANWTQITIDTSMLKPSPDSPQDTDVLKWSDCCDSVRSIVIGSWEPLPGDTVDLWIDDIRLNGVGGTDIR